MLLLLLRFFLLSSFFLACLVPITTQAQDALDQLQSYNKALIWRGFEHRWTYNHRINRIGSHVSYKDGEGYCMHYSATGLGSDSTFAKTHYTYVESPNVVFKETEIKILVNGHEGDLLNKTAQVYLDLDEWMQNKTHYDVLVNGFEVKSMTKADQLQLLRFLVEDPIYTKETQQIYLTTNFNLVTNCRTLECELFKNQTAYELTLHLLIIGFEEDAGEVRDSYTTRNYAWDTSVEVEDLSKTLNISGQRNVFPTACLGIKGIGVVLDEEHWILQMNSYVTPLRYNSITGDMRSHVNMKVVAWNNGMENFSVAPMKAEFAKRKSGFAMLETNPSLVQFSNAKIKHGSIKTSLYWRGRNKSSESPEAESIKIITPNLTFDK